MADELKIWALSEENEVEPVESVSGVALEDILEETLVARPEMLEPELQLVGRQTPTEGGQLDLLGVDGSGRLVVYELKRGALTRDAVTQCLDYGSWLATQSMSELSQHIASHSGYGESTPSRTSKIGIRVNLATLMISSRRNWCWWDSASTSVPSEWQNSCLTVASNWQFSPSTASSEAGETLLARQIEAEREATWGQRRRRQRTAEKQAALQELLGDHGATDLFNTVYETLRARMQRELPDTFDQNKERGIGLHARIAGKTPGQHRAFFNILVDETSGGLSIRLPRTAVDRYGRVPSATSGHASSLRSRTAAM